MMETAASALPSQPAPNVQAHVQAYVQTYVQAWAASLTQVLEQIGGSAFPCFVLGEAPPEPAPAAAGDLWILCACSGGLRGEMSLRLPSASILRLAQIFMSEPVAPEVELTSDHREAAVELLRQVGGLAASALKATWGEVQLRLESSVGAASWPASSTTWFRVGDESAAMAQMEMQLSAALVAAMRSEKTEAASTASPPAPAVANNPEQSRVKLDLLMDVELAVTLRFGSRQLLLRDVLDLIPGSVVNLDRQVQEPVDVLLDGRLLARGEVVVLNGNYGVRVTDVAPSS